MEITMQTKKKEPLLSSLLLLFIAPQTALRTFYLSWAMFGTGVGLLSLVYSSLISKAVPEKLRGTAFGLLTILPVLFKFKLPDEKAGETTPLSAEMPVKA